MSDTDNKQTQTPSKAPSMLSVVQSVLAAMFGVQSEEKRAQDFENGHIGYYIFVGVAMVIIFILTLVTIVNSILESSGQ